MSTTKISQLPVLTEITANDVLIVNDENSSTKTITFTNLIGSLPSSNITDLGDVDIAGATNGQVLTYSGATGDWSPTTISLQSTVDYSLTANGTSAYRFTGPGLQGTEDNPTIYLIRGQTYNFQNGMGLHPFYIRDDQGVDYNTGVTGAGQGVINGILVFEVPMDAPDSLTYVCDSHATMVGTFIINESLTELSAVELRVTQNESDIAAIPAPLANVDDSAQGIDVAGRVNTSGGVVIDMGGTLQAPGASIDFQSATISFSGASIGGLQGDISDGVDFHLNQTDATDGQVLSWNATGGALSTGDYEWIDPATGGGTPSASSFTWDASIIPDNNAQYDLGSAEFKVRHLFLSDNSIKFDSGDVGITEGRLTYADVPLATALLYQVTSAGNDSYVLDGPGIIGKPNPRLHLTRGETYYFNNTMGIHPMEIRIAADGAPYIDGVVGALRTDGVMSFTVPMDAPDTLVYQCTVHPSMVGEIYVMNDATTRIVDTNVPSANTDSGVPGEIRYGNTFLYICVATNSWKRVSLADF